MPALYARMMICSDLIIWRISDHRFCSEQLADTLSQLQTNGEITRSTSENSNLVLELHNWPAETLYSIPAAGNQRLRYFAS
jgi:hypothetical protein